MTYQLIVPQTKKASKVVHVSQANLYVQCTSTMQLRVYQLLATCG